jgi:hypothetical protein
MLVQVPSHMPNVSHFMAGQAKVLDWVLGDDEFFGNHLDDTDSQLTLRELQDD